MLSLGQTIATMKQKAERKLMNSLKDLRPDEAAVIMLLRDRLPRRKRKGGRSRRSQVPLASRLNK
jgi:hypothetical protein